MSERDEEFISGGTCDDLRNLRSTKRDEKRGSKRKTESQLQRHWKIGVCYKEGKITQCISIGHSPNNPGSTLKFISRTCREKHDSHCGICTVHH